MSRRLKSKTADRTGDRVKLHFSAIYLQSMFSSSPQTAGCSKPAQLRIQLRRWWARKATV